MNNQTPRLEIAEDSMSRKRKSPESTQNVAKQFHSIAQEDTPTNVSVPGNMAGLIMWALGRHGPIVLFVASTWFLYQDNKINQAAMLDVAKAQIAVNAQVVSQMTEVKVAITDLVEEAKRAHQEVNSR